MTLWRLAFILALSGAAFAQQYLPEQQGQVKLKVDYSAAARYALAPAARQAFTAKMDALAAVIRSTPSLQTPRGFDAWISPSINRSCDACTRAVAMADVPLVFALYRANESGQPAAADGDSTAVFHVNDIYSTVPYNAFHGFRYELDIADALGRKIYLAPRLTGEVDGVKIYDNSRIILSAGAQPVWLPVSREAFLNALIAKANQAAAEEQKATSSAWKDWQAGAAERERLLRDVKATLPAADAEKFVREARANYARMEAEIKARAGENAASSPVLQMVEKLRAELAALSPAERATQAWTTSGASIVRMEGSFLAPENAEGAAALITLNPRALDAARRTDVQLITVELGWNPPQARPATLEDADAANPANAHLLAFLRTVDWAQIRAVLR